MVVWGAFDRAGFTVRFLLWVCIVALGSAPALFTPHAHGQGDTQPDLEVTYSYWLDGQKAADLTVAFTILRVSDAGLETIVIDQTY